MELQWETSGYSSFIDDLTAMMENHRLLWGKIVGSQKQVTRWSYTSRTLGGTGPVCGRYMIS